MKFRLWLAVRMGVAPAGVGGLLTAEEFHQLHAMWRAGDFSGV